MTGRVALKNGNTEAYVSKTACVILERIIAYGYVAGAACIMLQSSAADSYVYIAGSTAAGRVAKCNVISTCRCAGIGAKLYVAIRSRREVAYLCIIGFKVDRVSIGSTHEVRSCSTCITS